MARALRSRGPIPANFPIPANTSASPPPLASRLKSIDYSDGWFDQTDGDGFSLVANDPDATDVVLSSKDGWRSGQAVNGIPGGADIGLLNNSIVINEVLPTASTGTNWVELKNQTDNDIDISGWFLSDDSLLRQKFIFPAGSIVPRARVLLDLAGPMVLARRFRSPRLAGRSISPVTPAMESWADIAIRSTMAHPIRMFPSGGYIQEHGRQ